MKLLALSYFEEVLLHRECCKVKLRGNTESCIFQVGIRDLPIVYVQVRIHVNLRHGSDTYTGLYDARSIF